MTDKKIALSGGRVKPTDYGLNRFLARTPVTHTLEEIETPGYLQNYTDVFARCLANGGMRLEVLADDYSVHAEYLVVAASRTDVTLRRLFLHHNESASDEAPEGRFRASFAPAHLWRVLDGDNVAAKGLQKEECHEWVAELNAGTKQLGDIPKHYAA